MTGAELCGAAMTECALRVKHTCTHDGKPLAVVDGLPGGNADLSPQQMRALALALLQAADDCEAKCRPRSRRRGAAPACATTTWPTRGSTWRGLESQETQSERCK